MSFATGSTDPSSSFTEDESLERNNNLVPGEHGANQRQRKIVSSKKDYKRKNERADECSTFLEVDLGGYSADKENKREQVDAENDSLAVIAAKIARKLSPKSSSNHSFFQGWTAYDIYLYSRHKRLLTNSRTIVIGLILLSILITSFVFIGAAVEKRIVDSIPASSLYYESPKVCAFLSTGGGLDILEQSFRTCDNFESMVQNYGRGASVAHCGECGSCSTQTDIDIYHSTKQSFKKDTMQCGAKIILGGKNRVVACMRERLGLTPDCEDCWVDNALCSLNYCFFSCAKESIFSRGGLYSDFNTEHPLSVYGYSQSQSLDPSNDGVEDKAISMNSCLECTEKMCGPRLLECAGTNRRRSGVHTDLDRDNSQICKHAQREWFE
mmetsp:Transcript_23252/g.35901  ORF Transcript_23252/g.35901 Transcript_23252/m.35901 type:complete len:382 (-) Transcript_23252:226-1371(-)